jgi:hypothetical protein
VTRGQGVVFVQTLGRWYDECGTLILAERGRNIVVERTQSLVLGFFALAWISLVVILLVDPAIYDNAMKLPAGRHPLADLAFLGGISAFIALLSVGVLRRWLWAFWLILVAFLIGGAVRTPVSVLELAGVLHPAGPAWYIGFQALLGLVQVAIGLLMLLDYRRAGLWGHRRPPAS